MQGFLQSAFLQALGYAITNSLWQVALLWLVVVAIKNIGRLSSAGKYAVAVTAEFAGFMWFLFTFRYYYTKCAEALSQVSSPLDAHTSVLEPAVKNLSSAVLYITIKGEQLLPYLSFAYLCILLFLAARLFRAFYFTGKIRRHGLEKPGVEWRLFVKKTACYLGIRKEVKIYFSHLIKCPVTLGFLKPLILVPIASINHLSTDQLEALLLHELAHIRRADYFVNIIQSIIEIILFFNPFIQLLGRFIKKERENSCDDWVLQFQYNPAMYAEALLTIACIPGNPSLAMNATGNKNDLLSRVKRMLNKQEKSYSYRNQVFALMLITVMLTTVAWFNPPAKYQAQLAKQTMETSKVMVEPLAMSADNPLFSPMYFFSKPIQQELDKAINEASDKVMVAAPEIQKKASGVLSTVTPLLLEKLQQVDHGEIDLATTAAETKRALAAVAIATEKLKDIPRFRFDSADVDDFVARNEFKNELNKTDWGKISKDIQKASDGLVSVTLDKQLSGKTTIELNTAINATLAQLDQLKKDKIVTFQNFMNAIGENARENMDLEALRQIATKTQQKMKEQQKKYEASEKKMQQPKRLKTYSDITDEDVLNYAPSENLWQPHPETYVPTAVEFRNIYRDSLQSALIIVRHDPANDSSHTKHIIVEITGNDGSHKTWDFSVDVYQ